MNIFTSFNFVFLKKKCFSFVEKEEKKKEEKKPESEDEDMGFGLFD